MVKERNEGVREAIRTYILLLADKEVGLANLLMRATVEVTEDAA